MTRASLNATKACNYILFSFLFKYTSDDDIHLSTVTVVTVMTSKCYSSCSRADRCFYLHNSFSRCSKLRSYKCLFILFPYILCVVSLNKIIYFPQLVNSGTLNKPAFFSLQFLSNTAHFSLTNNGSLYSLGLLTSIPITLLL